MNLLKRSNLRKYYIILMLIVLNTFFLYMCVHFLFSYIGQSCIVNDLFPVLKCGYDVTSRNADDCNVISSSRDTISTTSLECEIFGKGYDFFQGFA